MNQLLELSRRGLRRLLRSAGLAHVSPGHDWADPRTFIPFEETLAGAAAAGLSVADFVDRTHNRPGATREHVSRLVEHGVFRDPIERVCEIGPGSGRYLEKVIEICRSSHYEIYETAQDWAMWLEKEYGVKWQPTGDGLLAATPSSSIDLVHAHKVFSTIPWLPSCRYLLEMARVVRPRGKVVFDVMTERCLDVATVRMWLERRIAWGSYPAVFPRQLVIDILGAQGLSLSATFLVPMEPGSTECMIFSRSPPA